MYFLRVNHQVDSQQDEYSATGTVIERGVQSSLPSLVHDSRNNTGNDNKIPNCSK